MDELRQKMANAEARSRASRRAAELFNLVYSSVDPEDALSRLVAEWGLDEASAKTILTTQIQGLTETERDRAVRRAQQLRTVLAQLRDSEEPPRAADGHAPRQRR